MQVYNTCEGYKPIVGISIAGNAAMMVPGTLAEIVHIKMAS